MDLLAQIKKSVASVALATFALTIGIPFVNAALPFTDAAEIPSWAEEAIEELMDQGVISGNDDGSFAPNRQLNRAEVSKIIVLASGVDFDTTGGPHFPDVARDAWYYDYIETMYNYGWVNGYPDGFFRPGNGINRAEVAKMAINAFEMEQDLAGAPHFDDVSAGDWHYGYIETAYNNGLMRGYGDGTFGPANAVTRSETAHIVYNTQLASIEPVGPAEGTLEVFLSDDTPRGTNVPYNSTSVPYLTVDVTASDDSDVEISSLTFTRLGLGDNDDFDNVWLEIDGFKVGNDKSVNNDDIVELRFNPPVVVPAGQTLLADVVASAKYTATTDENIGHHNRFALVSAEDVASTAANVVGDFPIEGEEMEVADYEVSTLTFTNLGSDTTVDVGDNFIEIGKFRLLNGSNTNKDVELRAITFKNDGTAEIADDLENVALYVAGEQISAESIMDGDYITFRLDNGVTGGYVIEDGDSRIFSLRADIVSAEASDTIKFKVDNYEDIVGVEIGTSFGVKAVDANGVNAEDAYATLAEYTIDSGDLNISRDPSSLGNQEYSPGSNDVVFMTARVVVDQPLLVDGLHIWMNSSSTAHDDGVTYGDKDGTPEELADFNAVFDNFRLFLNDRLVDTENDFEDSGTNLTLSASTQYRLNFNTTFEIAGTSIIKVVGNVADGAYGASSGYDQLKLTLSASDFQSPEYISTGDQVVSTQLLGSATSSFVQVRTSILTVTETSGLTDDDKIVAGVDDVTFMQFVVDNNDSGDVNVTSLTVGADTDQGDVVGNAVPYTNFTLGVFVDGTQQGSSKNLSSAGKATFNDLSVVIPSAGQKEFTVVVDTIEASAGNKDHASTTAFTALNAGDTVATGDMTIATYVDFVDNETVRLVDTTGSDDLTCLVNGTPNATTTVVLVTCTVTATGVAIAADYTFTAATTTITTTTSKLKLDLEAVDADNVENGQTVTVTDDGSTEITASHEVAGKRFELVSSGSLTVSLDSQISQNVILAGQSNVEILKVRFNAANDEVQVKDLYFENDVDNDETVDNTSVGERMAFKLYDEAGQLLQEEIMSGGTIHFELANQDRIRVPKDDSTFITVKADVRSITDSNQTGKRLRLSLDNNLSTSIRGVEAVTAATGNDITTPTATPYWEGIVDNVASQNFVAYKSEIVLAHSPTQPASISPFSSLSEAYRFNVTSDSAGATELERVTLDVSLQGMSRTAPTNSTVVNTVETAGDLVFTPSDFEVRRVVNGSVDDQTSVAAITAVGTEATYTLTLSATIEATDIFQINVGGISSSFTAADTSTTNVATGIAASLALNPNVSAASSASNVVTFTTRPLLYNIGTTTDSGVDVTITDVGGAITENAVLALATAKTLKKARVTVDFTNQTLSEGETITYTLKMTNLENDGGGLSNDDSIAVGFVADTTYNLPIAQAGQKVLKTAASSAGGAGTITVTAAEAAQFSVGETVYLYDVSVPATSNLVTIATITAATGVITFADNSSFFGTNITAAAGDFLCRNSNIVWSDRSNTQHSNSTSDWLNGYLLDIATTAKSNS